MSIIRQTLILITLLLAGSLLTAAQAPETKMSKEDRTKVLKWLDESSAQTIAAVEKLSDAQWSFKAAPEKAMTTVSF